ncbi:DEAD/DEAH box helicase [Lacticigenium naphthae]|uniref:DEAD/DEAH box helicase n=1 Tax=Lacticigenium naphthae TaxID=515351 RepID=UPI000427E295|nr:helicase-related protein [Lacticigenium naphthae]
MQKNLLMGRQLLKEEIEKNCVNEDKWEDNAILKKISGFTKIEGSWKCNRCGEEKEKMRGNVPCTCGKDCFYCKNCIQMGRVKKCSMFYSQEEKNDFFVSAPCLTWIGSLSKQQYRGSQIIKKAIQENNEQLVWAVTGAGKTEMLFEGIEWGLIHNKRICIASPRLDVCLELAPRIKEAFKEVPLSVLHGKMEGNYQYTPLVIATTHQLFRFKQAFDVLIIDEMDAFPYERDESLHYASQTARKSISALIYLTATPNQAVQKQIFAHQMDSVQLPVRYHQKPLVVPQVKYIRNLDRKLLTRNTNQYLFKWMQMKMENKKKFLIFFHSIEVMDTCAKYWETVFPEAVFKTVSSESTERKETVRIMREEQLDFLMTTTILERGVTFKNIDVVVLHAENHLFTESSLVQIAGRVGRNADFSTGEIVFIHEGMTTAIRKAIKQIKRMNALARKEGYLEQ